MWASMPVLAFHIVVDVAAHGDLLRVPRELRRDPRRPLRRLVYRLLFARLRTRSCLQATPSKALRRYSAPC